MTEVTMEKLEPLLRSISVQIENTNSNVLAIRHDLEEARKDINATIKDNAVMDEKIKNHQEQDQKDHENIKDSLNKNWEKTRQIEGRFNKWFWILTGIYTAVAFYLKFFNK